MYTNCKECGCLCSMCSANSLDLHHEIEVLKASLSQAKLSINQLKAELKTCQEERDVAKAGQSIELSKLQDKYNWLEGSHSRLETVNHDLEDKILELVQQNDEEQQQTMSIHEDLHKKLKNADQRVQDIIQEKDALASQCQVVLDLMKKSTQTTHGNTLISREIFRLNKAIQQHEQAYPVEPDDSSKTAGSSFIPVATFPPCAIMFDHSPKTTRKVKNQNLPRNFSDSRLAKMQLHPTDLKLCSRCKEIKWTRNFSTQTEVISSVLREMILSESGTRPSNNWHNGVFEV